MKKNVPISKGHRRALDYLEEMVHQPKINEEILTLRKRYKIPSAGYGELAKSLIDRPPLVWRTDKTADERSALFDSLAKEAYTLLNSLGFFQSMVSPSPLLNYIFSGELIEMDASTRALGIPQILEPSSIGPSLVFDAKSDRKVFKKLTLEKQKEWGKIMDAIDENFPLAIRFNPNVSLNEFIEDITRKWPVIKSYFDEYLNNDSNRWSTRLRDSFKKERDKLILEYEGKSIVDFRKEFIKRFPGKVWPSPKLINAVRSNNKKKKGGTK